MAVQRTVKKATQRVILKNNCSTNCVLYAPKKKTQRNQERDKNKIFCMMFDFVCVN
jgi:hypothetical protein